MKSVDISMYKNYVHLTKLDFIMLSLTYRMRGRLLKTHLDYSNWKQVVDEDVCKFTNEAIGDI